MKKRFLYDLAVEKAKPLIKSQLQGHYKEAALVTDFIDYHNDTCPRCQNKLKVYNNTVKNIGSVSGFYFTAEQTIYMYAVCKPCSNELAVLSRRQQTEDSDKAQCTEDYILNELSKALENE